MNKCCPVCMRNLMDHVARDNELTPYEENYLSFTLQFCSEKCLEMYKIDEDCPEYDYEEYNLINDDARRFYHFMHETEQYWIDMQAIKEFYPDVYFRPMKGITSQLSDDGHSLTPHRDLRKHMVYSEAYYEHFKDEVYQAKEYRKPQFNSHMKETVDIELSDDEVSVDDYVDLDS